MQPFFHTPSRPKFSSDPLDHVPILLSRFQYSWCNGECFRHRRSSVIITSWTNSRSSFSYLTATLPLHVLESALWLLAFSKVWHPPRHDNPIFNKAACSAWRAYIKKTKRERQWNGTIPPFPIAILKSSILADFQGIRTNTLMSIIFFSCRHGRCLTLLSMSQLCPGIT